MNWLDILILVVLGLGALWGIRTGLINAAITAVGVLIGWLLAGQFADEVGELFGDSLNNDTLVTVVSYALIIAASLLVTGFVAKMLKPALVVIEIASMGLNRLGGLALGLVIGLVVSSAIIVGMARFAYNFELPTPEIPGLESVSGLQGVSGTSVEGLTPKLEDAIPAVADTKETVVTALTESKIVPVFMDVRGALPEDALGFIPSDFNAALDILELEIE